MIKISDEFHNQVIGYVYMNYPKIRANKDMRKAFMWLALVAIAYIALTLIAPAAQAVTRYGLTLTQANLVRVTIVLPILFIWATAMFGVIWFRRYTKLVKGSQEEDAFLKFTLGLWMLFLVIIVPSFVTVIFSYFPDNMTAQHFGIILRNYVTIVLYGAGFWYIYQASRSLLSSVEGVEWGNRYRPIMLSVLGIMTFVYTWLIFQNPFRHISNDPLVVPTYALNDWLIVSTIILPYILIWLFGGMAVLNIWSYAKTVSGVIYRQTFRYMAQGLSVTIILLIFLQLLSQGSVALNHATLKIILIIIYLILFSIAMGYWFIAKGAQKLTEIEEVE